MRINRASRSADGALVCALALIAVVLGVAGSSTATQTAGRGTRGPTAGAQEDQLGPPTSPQNLQVLPADMSTRAVIGVMRGFASALGVRCTHCHVGDDPSELSTINFVSDEREAKRIARVMMRMVQTLNDDLLKPGLREAGRSVSIDVRCATCHHGNTRPVTLGAVLIEAFERDGVEGMLDRYDSLRERHYGGWTYDFGEGSLLGLAERFANTGNMEAAMAAIDKNLEVHPASFSAHVTRGQILVGAGDSEGAKAAFQACLDADPSIGWCQQQIDEINRRER